MRDHRKLTAFQLADRLAIEVYQQTKAFPREEQFGLTFQIRKSAVSIASNIVEGCARASKADYLRFLDIAYGSARELEYQLSIAHRLGFFHDATGRQLRELAEEVGRVLFGLIQSLKKTT